MKTKISFLLLSAYVCNVCGLHLPGPLVYVVTPSPRPQTDGSMSRSAPFYYQNWMRRMDQPVNATTTTTTEGAKTHDLIFAEFEPDSDSPMRKSIRKLLEKEKIESKKPTTSNLDDQSHSSKSESPPSSNVNIIEKKPEVDMTDYFALYNNLYNNGENAPVYLPSTTASTTRLTTTQATTTTQHTTSQEPMKVENIWHIIDNEKYGHYSGNWEEIPVDSEETKKVSDDPKPSAQEELVHNDDTDAGLDENFALPGFGTNPGNGAENESRAIRTESNSRFPYVNLKPFLMKPGKVPYQNLFLNSKKTNNMFSLNDFKEIRQPVRGEIQDIGAVQPPIDRYNPAQPYLPAPEYGSKSKQSSPTSPPVKAVANLVPPPVPPIPKVTGDDFPAPNNYDSFPPYAPFVQDSGPPLPSPQARPISVYQPPKPQPPPPMTDDLDSDVPPSADDEPSMDLGYRYKPPSQVFLPTVAPISKPFKGYSYDKPMMAEVPPPMDTNIDNFQGYHYNKPESSAPTMDHSYGPMEEDHDHPPPESYGPDDHDHYHAHHHDSSYPELIFDKPHGGKGGKGGKGGDDMGMAPPPPDVKPDSDSPMDDSGFPSDFPGDLKFSHDFDHHHDDHIEYHHHPPPTTTEMPRVNRYSYYYLGKKLYYLPLYFSVYFIVYVGALIIKAVLRHKIVYPNSWRPNDQTASFFSKRSVDSWELSDDQLHNISGRVTRAIASAAEKYMPKEKSN